MGSSKRWRHRCAGGRLCVAVRPTPDDYFFFLLADFAFDAADLALVAALALACFFSLFTWVAVFASAGALTSDRGATMKAALMMSVSICFTGNP